MRLLLLSRGVPTRAGLRMAPGELVAIGGGDVAFVPHELPPRDRLSGSALPAHLNGSASGRIGAASEPRNLSDPPRNANS